MTTTFPRITTLPRITTPRRDTVMVERLDADGRVIARRYVPQHHAYHMRAAGWIVWVPAGSGWKREE